MTDREIIEAATEGPWGVASNGSAVVDKHGDVVGKVSLKTADAVFISTARTRWPAALDEIERLRAVIKAEAHEHGQRVVYKEYHQARRALLLAALEKKS